MNENETLTDINLSDETIENMNNGTVEIQAEISKTKTDRKSGCKSRAEDGK